jgi:hypothetical protein
MICAEPRSNSSNIRRVIKESRALQKVGYTVHGMGDQVAYGTGIYETYSVWQDEKQFRKEIKMYIDMGVDLVQWANEPDLPMEWIREVINDSGKDVKLVIDFHDLDSIRKKIIPLPEQKAFIYADGIIYASQPIQEIENNLHSVTKPNTAIFSYCNDGIIEYKEEDIFKRHGLVYEGGANPPDDEDMDRQFAYRSLYNIMKKLVEMRNETWMFCGNLSAYDTYQGTGAILVPPTPYEEMMNRLVNFKYGLAIFNNEDGKKDQVNLTLTNKEHEYLQAGLPTLACWCPETMRHVDRHKIGFTFNHISDIGDCSQLNSQYPYIMENIKRKRRELVMENFVVRLENLYAELLGVEKKGIPDNIREINIFEYGKEDTEKMLN